MAYSGCLRVADLVLNLTNSASSIADIATGVVPGSAAYVRWMSSGCSLIEGKLVGAGYSVPVPSSTQLYDFVADLEAQYVAYRAEQSRGSTRSGTGDRTRADGFKAAFDDGLKELLTSDLTRMGMTHTSKLYGGGIEASDKDLDKGDSDLVQPRFGRGVFDGDGYSPQPNTRNAS